VKLVKWDLIIFHTLFLSLRYDREQFKIHLKNISFLKKIDAVKVALPQDEYLNMDLVCNFITEFNINHIFTVSPQSEWTKLYPTIDREKVRLHRILTGYIDEKTLRKIEKLNKKNKVKRFIDIGYRAQRTPFWLGRLGSLKWKIADEFNRKTSQQNIVVDISTRDEDTFFGLDWYRFLLKCKYQIGVEGGSSVLDWDGTFRKRTEEYLKRNPDSSFEEVEANCFPGVDGYINLVALSPRNLEACMTRTCQILVEGKYNGILIPGKHYVELKRDFSNIKDVLEIVKKDEMRDEIVENAWNDIVGSGRYTYRVLTDTVISRSLKVNLQQSNISIIDLFIYYIMKINDILSSYAREFIMHFPRLIEIAKNIRNTIIRT
jgi:hypothetical protein